MRVNYRHYPSVFSGYSTYVRGDYPNNKHRHFIPIGITLVKEHRLKLFTEVLTSSATGTDSIYTLQFIPMRNGNVFIYLNGIRDNSESFIVSDGHIIFSECIPQGWSVVACYSKSETVPAPYEYDNEPSSSEDYDEGSSSSSVEYDEDSSSSSGE